MMKLLAGACVRKKYRKESIPPPEMQKEPCQTVGERACRVVVAILALLKKLSKHHIGVLSTDVQAMEQSVNIACVGDENVAVILTKPLMVDVFDWGRTVARISRTCRGGTAEQMRVHNQVYSPMTTNFSGSDSTTQSVFLNPNILVTLI